MTLSHDMDDEQIAHSIQEAYQDGMAQGEAGAASECQLLRAEIERLTRQWQKTNGEYQRVSKALCRVQQQLAAAQARVKELEGES